MSLDGAKAPPENFYGEDMDPHVSPYLETILFWKIRYACPLTSHGLELVMFNLPF